MDRNGEGVYDILMSEEVFSVLAVIFFVAIFLEELLNKIINLLLKNCFTLLDSFLGHIRFTNIIQ